MKRAISLVSVLSALACSAPDAPEPNADTSAALSNELVNVYVVLDGPSAIDAAPKGVALGSAQAVAAVRTRLREQSAQRAQITPLITKLGGSVIADISRLANVLQVLIPENAVHALERIPGVVRIDPVPHYELTLSSAVPVVGAPALWQNSTPFDGDGITIGIVDSGIDYTHTDFAGAGQAAFEANDPTLIEAGTFPTAKVVGGHDFVGANYFPGGGVEQPSPDPDPLDCLKPQSMQVAGGHGTHVAGIAAGTGVSTDGKTFAGPYNQSLDPAQFRIGPGVAPKAKLYALKIFGCQGGTTMLGAALERAVDPNQDGDLSDRLDVVNASLGTSYAISSLSQEKIVENLVAAGSLFVAAAGNEGDAFFATSTPGSYKATLSVAASADNQLIALEVTAPASIAGQLPAAEGGFTTRLIDSGPKSGGVVYVNPSNGCNTFTNAAAIAGKVALVDRGDCSFVKKFNGAVAAGAIAMIVVDDEDQAVPFAMGGGDPGQVPIPGVMVKKSDGDKLKAALSQGLEVALDGTKLFQGPGNELLAGFSSRGPSADDERLKPEIAAPGFAIDSARVGSGSAPRRSQGTSMASPMVAGAAALVRQARPSFSALEVKSALVVSATPLSDLDLNPYPASLVGSGRLAVDRAAALDVTAAVDGAGTVGLSFGLMKATAPITENRTVTLTNHGSQSIDYAVSAKPVAELAGVTVSVEPTTLTLAAGQIADVTLTLAVDPAALPAAAPDPATPPTQYDQPRHFLTETSGHVVFSSSAAAEQSLVVPYFAAVRHDLERSAKPLAACPSASAASGPLAIEIAGETGNVTPAVSAFRLGSTHPLDPASETDPRRAELDLLAVGVATDLAAKDADWQAASLFFGVVIAGEWTTPAQGVRSVANVFIDSTGDGAADYVIRAEPFTRDGPYLDVLTATTYRVDSGEPTESRRFLNMLPVTTINTQPFHNSVIVLPTFLKDIGVNADNPIISYSAFTDAENPFEPGEQTEWSSFDITKPGIDTALEGLESRPVFSGNQVLVHFGPDSAQAALPQLLLLHHTNARGKRFEIVDLVDPSQPSGNVVLSASAPEAAVVGEHVTFDVTASNQNGSADANVTLTGKLSGATIASLGPGCTETDAQSFSCDLGALASGAQAVVSVEAIVAESAAAGSASLDVSADVELPCETSTADNTATASVPVGAVERSDSELEPGGGCACRVGDHPSSERALAALFALVAASLARRRRGRR